MVSMLNSSMAHLLLIIEQEIKERTDFKEALINSL
jgi:hypothetical protein